MVFMDLLLLQLGLLYIVAASLLNGNSPYPKPHNFTMIPILSDLLYEDMERSCFCKIDYRRKTSCYGQDCKKLPRNVTILNRSLRISGTAITSFSRDDFVGYEDLLELQIDGNEVSNISPGTFSDLSKLMNLSISFNQLEYIREQAFVGLVSLRRLRLVKNQFRSVRSVTPAVARLPHLRELVLSENAFSRINSGDFTVLLNSSIEVLELANCALNYINPEALLPLRQLKRLQLSENVMSDENLVHVIFMLRHSQLQILHLTHLFAGSPPRALLEILSRSNVSALDLQKNTLPRLKNNTFPLMPSLRSLDLSDCGVIDIDDNSFSPLPSLRRLNLASNTLLAIPVALMLPQLQYLSLRDNSGGNSGDLEIRDGNFMEMANLTFLDLSNNRIGQLTKDVFIGLSLLEELQLNKATLYRLIAGCFKPLVSLKVLQLAGNILSRQKLGPTLFQGLHQLEYLNLDDCRISSFSQQGVFSGCRKLRTLSMRNNAIMFFNVNPFVDAASLTSIDLANNQIRGWMKKLLSSSPNMKLLDLTNNHISTATKAMLQDVGHLQEVNLHGNPLDCNCQLLPFKKYVLPSANQSQLVIKVDYCSSPSEWRFAPVAHFLAVLQHQHCDNNTAPFFEDEYLPWLTIVYVIAPLIFIAGLMTLAAYRSRWLIRYYLFRRRLTQFTLKEVTVDAGDYQYDAFVSHSNEDQAFVVQLMDRLEKQSPYYKLCVYERDFTAGTVLNDCIIQSIATSRKVVLIISHHFIHSQWCLWELHLAQHSLLEEKREGLVLIVVGKVKPSDLPPTLRFLMKTRIYLEWNSEPTKQDLFWVRLRNALAPAKKRVLS